MDPEVARLDPHRDGARTRTRALDEAIRADNACLEGARRPGVTLAMHLCRGNNRSHWYAEGGYDPIAEKLFTTIAGGPLPPRVRRRALRDVRAAAVRAPRQDGRARPGQQQAAASSSPPTSSARRIEEASRYVPLDDLALSPAVRLRLDDGGQPPHRGRPVGEARPGREGRPGGLGLSRRPGSSARGHDAIGLSPLLVLRAPRGAPSRHRGLGARMDARRPVRLPGNRPKPARRP